MIGIAVALIAVGLGLYVNRYISRWRYRGDARIMTYVEPMSRLGLLLLAIGIGLIFVGVIASAV